MVIKRAKMEKGKPRVHCQTKLRQEVYKFVSSESKKRNVSISELIDLLLYDYISR